MLPTDGSATNRRANRGDTTLMSPPGPVSGGRRARRTAQAGQSAARSNSAPAARVLMRTGELAVGLVVSLLIIFVLLMVVGAVSYGVYDLTK